MDKYEDYLRVGRAYFLFFLFPNNSHSFKTLRRIRVMSHTLQLTSYTHTAISGFNSKLTKKNVCNKSVRSNSMTRGYTLQSIERPRR